MASSRSFRAGPGRGSRTARIGPPARDAVPALTDVVKKDREPRPAGALPPTGMARVFAIQALGRIGPDAFAKLLRCEEPPR